MATNKKTTKKATTKKATVKKTVKKVVKKKAAASPKKADVKKVAVPVNASHDDKEPLKKDVTIPQPEIEKIEPVAPEVFAASDVEPVKSSKKNLLVLGVVILITLFVVMEVGVLMKSKVDRQRSLKEVTTLGERGGQKRLNAFQGTTAEKVDALDRLLLVDAEWNKVMVYDLATDKLLFVIDGEAVGRELFAPADADADKKGNIYVLDSIHHDVSAFTKEGKFINRWPAQNGVALSVDNKGNILVADNHKMEIRRFAADGKVLKTFGGAGTGKGKFMRPYRMDIDSKGNICIIDQGNQRVQVLTSNGKVKKTWPLKFEPNNLTGISIYKDELYVNDFSNGFIWIYSATGKVEGQIKIAYPSNLAIDSKGYYYLPGPGGISRFVLLKGKKAQQ